MSIDSMSSWRAPLRRLAIAATLVSMLGSSGRADADGNGADTPASIWSLSGFGTFGVVHSTEREADFTSSLVELNGAGYSRAWSPGVDSRIGAQLTANFTPRFSAIAQGLAQQNFDGSYTPHLEWANLKFAFTPDASMRVGRIVLPSLLVSDTRAIGYAYPEARPPIEVYSIIPVTSSDGVDASYRLHFGDAANTIVGTFGSSRFGVAGFGTLAARREWVIADTLEYGAVTVHLAYEQALIVGYPASVEALFIGLKNFGPQGELLSAKYDPDRKLAQAASIGATVDPGAWYITGELIKREAHSAFSGDSTGWYVSGGPRIGAYTPFVIYSQLRSNANRSDPGLTVSALPPYLAPAATELNAGLNTALRYIEVQSTISVGARWDFIKNVDLTVQLSHTHLGAGSAGLLINTQPGFQPGGSFNLFSLALDFVW